MDNVPASSWPRIPANLLDHLTRHEIAFGYYEHPPVATVAESAVIKETIPGIHTKNLFLTDRQGSYFLVAWSAQHRFPINRLRKILWCKELTFGSPDDLQRLLGVTPGSVSLLGLLHQPPALSVFLDHAFLDQPAIGRHPNRNDATLTLAHHDACRLVTARWYTPYHLYYDIDNDSLQLDRTFVSTS